MKYFFNNNNYPKIEIKSVDENGDVWITIDNNKPPVYDYHYKFNKLDDFDNLWHSYWRNKGRFLGKLGPYFTKEKRENGVLKLEYIYKLISLKLIDEKSKE